jgi:hypothetical protein
MVGLTNSYSGSPQSMTRLTMALLEDRWGRAAAAPAGRWWLGAAHKEAHFCSPWLYAPHQPAQRPTLLVGSCR